LASTLSKDITTTADGKGTNFRMEWRFWARTRPAHLTAFGDASGDDCEAVEPLLSLYGDGMASPAEARLVETHLPGCESCRESLAWMQATRRALSGRPVQSPPAGLHARIAEAIAASDAAPLRLRPARTFATRPAFAAAASLAAVGLFLGYSLSHPSQPTVAVKPVPPPSVAVVPTPPPSVTVAPIKPTAPTVTIKKPTPAPLFADKNVPYETLPVPVAPPAPRAAAKNTERPVPTAPPVTAPRPSFKPVAPRPPSVVAFQPPAPAKTLKPLPPKPSVLTAKNEVKEPDVQVLTPTVTVQKPMETASASEPHTQNVDFISEVRAQIKARAHLPSPQAQISRTVGLSLRGAAAATGTFGSEGGAAHVANIVGVATK